MPSIMQVLSFLSFAVALKSISVLLTFQDHHQQHHQQHQLHHQSGDYYNNYGEDEIMAPFSSSDGRKMTEVTADFVDEERKMEEVSSTDKQLQQDAETTNSRQEDDNDSSSSTGGGAAADRDWKNLMMTELQPTFDGYHDFIKEDGPRERPYSIGRSISELVQDSSTIGDKPVNVTFYLDQGTYYAAAWLATTTAFLENPNLNFEKIRKEKKKPEGWVLEQGTWVGVNGRDNYRTVDMLDFFVHHLSRYKGGTSVRGPELKVNWQRYLDGLDKMQYAYEDRPFNNPNLDRNGRVLVICPFHGATDNHSGQDEKNLHLNVTVKGLARVFPNIVITVCNQANFDFVTKHSGLNDFFYDVLLIKNLNDEPIADCINLPFLSNLQVRRRLEQQIDPQRYDPDYFQWVYYTESDQPPHMTDVNALLQETLQSDRTVVVPYRGHPAALAHELNMTLAKSGAKKFTELNKHKEFHRIEDLRDYSCCFNHHDITSRKRDRIKWEWASPKVELFQQYGGHAQATGYCNPMLLTCVTCTIRNRTGSCPLGDTMMVPLDNNNDNDNNEQETDNTVVEEENTMSSDNNDNEQETETENIVVEEERMGKDDDEDEATDKQVSSTMTRQEEDDDSSDSSDRDRKNLMMTELQTTFDGYHDFVNNGRRERPYSIGHSISELQNNPSTIGDKPVNVTFYLDKASYYAAAWLATTEAFLENPNLNFEKLKKEKKKPEGWVLEQGTWVGVNGRDNYRTVDMLDFFVHHLSRYKGGTSVRGPELKVNWQRYLDGLDKMQYAYEERPFNNPNLDRNGRVLVICPFHGATDNHSAQDEKNLHLNVTVKGLARVFPNIVITVCNQANFDYVTKHSGLNDFFYDVLLIKNLNDEPIADCINLPFLSNLQVRRRLEQQIDPQRYDPDYFQWVYYTESDQPPHLTDVNALLTETLHSDRAVVVPYRGHPAALAHELDMKLAKRGAREFTEMNKHKEFHRIEDLRDYSCCFDQHTISNPNNKRRASQWSSPKVQLFQQYGGHALANGWCNALRLTCVTCTIQNRTGACPSGDTITITNPTAAALTELTENTQETNNFVDEQEMGNDGDKQDDEDSGNDDDDNNKHLTMHQELQPSFDGYHDFANDGPREQFLDIGLSIPELLLQGPSSTIDDDKPVNVTFFENQGGAYYSAAWLATTANFLNNPNLDFDTSQTGNNQNSGGSWNLEAGTWVGIRDRANFRTTDFLDFFAHHLSRYKGGYSVGGPHHKVNWQLYLETLVQMQRDYEQLSFNNPNQDRNGRVLVICPFHGASDNHSGQDEKHLHLNVTVKALARVFPSVVVTVCDQANFDYVTKHSGLNEYLFDVVMVKKLNMVDPIEECQTLPFLSNVHVRRLLEKNETEQQRRYSQDHFQWVYYTESDQPLHLTNLNALLTQSLHNRRTVVCPHRTHPVALETELDFAHGRPNFKKMVKWNREKTFHRVDDLRDYSCCFSTNVTMKPNSERPKWTWTSPKIEIFQQYGAHAQATGTCNPNLMQCITCTFQKRSGSCEEVMETPISVFTNDRQNYDSQLQPTFDGYHDFANDGPRERPSDIGRSIPEILQDPSTSGDKPVNVTFYKNQEAYYAAAWLSSTANFLSNPHLDLDEIQKESENSGGSWNLESGTWVGVRDRDNYRTVDMFDFFVHHLSRYKGGTSVRGPELKINWLRYLDGLDKMQHAYEERPFNNPNLDRNGRVLVICPFHGASDNHSGQDEKNLHLNVTVKGLARVFPNIVITVCNQANFDYVTKHSGLNEYVYDVLLIKSLNNEPVTDCGLLPFLTSVNTRRLLENNETAQEQRYDPDYFQWVYYTESDQPPHMTNVNALLQQTLDNPRAVVVPYRGHPAALAHELDMTVAKRGAQKFTEINKHKVFYKISDLRDYSCCFDQHTTTSRNSERHKYEWNSTQVELFQQYGGHAQANGWCNPLLLTCITCTIQDRDGPCPQ